MTEETGHLDDATWERLASDELPAAERERALAHVLSCRSCARLWRGLLVVRREARRFDPGVPRASATGAVWSAWASQPAWQLLAASLLVAVVGGVLAYRLALGPPDTQDRLPSPASATRGDIPLRSDTPAWVSTLTLAKAEIRVSPQDVLVFRGRNAAEEPSLDALAAGLEPYRRDEFAEAARRLGELRAGFPRSARVGLYLGVSLLFLDRADEAIAPLETALASDDPALARDARWYLAIAHAKAGRLDAAEGVLRPLCAERYSQARRACEAIGEKPSP